MALARSLRRRPAEHETRLWGLLRDRRLVGYKFRRQVPIGPYVADFACLDARLVIELDGSQHIESERDRVRDAWLSGGGYRVLRFWNSDLTGNRDGVLETIWLALQGGAE